MSSIRFMLFLLGAGVLVSCSTVRNINVGEDAEISNKKYRLSVKSDGRIGVLQKLQGTRCEDSKLNFTVSIYKSLVSKSFPVIKDCLYQKQSVVYWSKQVLPAGDYLILLESSIPSRTQGLSKIIVKYSDPDFDSGDDFVPEGSRELEVGKVLKGKVDATIGNSTDWVHVASNDGRIPLLFTLKDKSSEVEAQVFSAEGEHLKVQGRLTPRKKSLWTSSEEGVWVRFQAKHPLAAGEYTIMRSDITQGKKSVSLNVLDRFPTSENAYTFLIESENLKAKDKISIFGKNAIGRMDFLGKCSVSSVENNQARCDLKGMQGKDYSEFKASQKEEG